MRVLRNQTALLLEDSIMLCAEKKGAGLRVRPLRFGPEKKT